jgi:hypothetical protein
VDANKSFAKKKCQGTIIITSTSKEKKPRYPSQKKKRRCQGTIIITTFSTSKEKKRRC